MGNAKDAAEELAAPQRGQCQSPSSSSKAVELEKAKEAVLLSKKLLQTNTRAGRPSFQVR